MPELTPAECAWLAHRLHGIAGRKAKDLERAVEADRHPNLILELRAEIATATRLALKLQDIGLGQ